MANSGKQRSRLPEDFFTTSRIVQEQSRQGESARGKLLFASCRSGHYLAASVVEQYRQQLAQAGYDGHVQHLANIDYQFSDSETCVRLETDVSGHDVFLFQALYDPNSDRTVDENYLAFLIAARTLREWGANHITAVLPYLAYARQDKPTKFQREPTTAKLMADLSREAGIDRLLVWHPHYSQTQGFYGRMPVDVLEALNLFVAEFQHLEGRQDVIAVAPDIGASKFVTYFSRALNLKSAIASKYRPEPEESQVTELIGDFSEKRVAIVLDDMISSGGTVSALIKRLVKENGLETIYVAASHNLCLESAQDRLATLHQDFHLARLVTTNSIPQTESFESLPFVSVLSLANILSRVINRIHYNRSVTDLFYEKERALGQ